MSRTILQRLRAETSREHQSLDDELNLTGPGLTLTYYKAVLQAFYGYYLPFESRLFTALPAPAADIFTDRHRLPALLADLTFFGIDTTALPLCADLPAWPSPAAVWGALYVTEGATLGGQIIGRELERRLNLRHGAGYSFFQAYGPETGARWREFCSLLLAQVVAVEEEDVIGGAAATFRTLQAWLRASGLTAPAKER